MDRDRSLSNWFAIADTFGGDTFSDRPWSLLGHGPSCYNPNKKNKTRKRPKRNKKYGVNK